MNHRASLGLLLVGLVTAFIGCRSKDTRDGPLPNELASAQSSSSYKDDLQMICDASIKAPKGGADSLSARATEIAKWIDAQPKSEKAKRFFSDVMGTATPGEKAKVLRTEMKANGGDSCALADWYEAGSKVPPTINSN